MSEEEIRSIVQQEMQSYQQKAGYGLSLNPYHTHNGVDSQKVPFLNLSDAPSSYYNKDGTSNAGSTVVVNDTATGLTFGSGGTYYGQIVSNAAGTIFPTGWTLTYVSGTPYYQVNHTLDTSTYGVVATTTQSSGTLYSVTWYDKTSTSFRLYVNVGTSGAASANVDFIVFT